MKNSNAKADLEKYTQKSFKNRPRHARAAPGPPRHLQGPFWANFGPWEPRKPRKIHVFSAWELRKPRKTRGFSAWEPWKPRTIRSSRAWGHRKPRKIRGFGACEQLTPRKIRGFRAGDPSNHAFWLGRLGRSCRARVPPDCRKHCSKSLFKRSFQNL